MLERYIINVIEISDLWQNNTDVRKHRWLMNVSLPDIRTQSVMNKIYFQLLSYYLTVTYCFVLLTGLHYLKTDKA